MVIEAPMGLSSSAKIAAIILVTAATLWVTEAVPLFVTSMVVLMMSLGWLLPELDRASIDATSTDFLAPFFSDVVLLFLGGFVLSAGLHRYQIDAKLAKFIIARTGRSVPRLMLGVMAVTAVLSMWLSNSATTATMLALCLPIIQSLPADDPHRKSLVLCIPFAANIGGLGTPIGSPPNAIALEYLQQTGNEPEFWMWMLIGVPGVALMLGIAWGVLRLLFRGEQMHVELPTENEINMTDRWPVWVVLVGSAITVAGWVTAEFHGFSSGTVALVPVILFFGLRLLSVSDFRSLSWDVLLLLGGGACLGVVISKSGLDQWIVQHIPLEDTGVYWLMVTFGCLAVMMSSVMSNTAAANLLMPIALGMQPSPISPVLIGIAFCCTLSMPLPISTPPNAMAFGSGELNMGDMLRAGVVLTIVGTALALTTGYWWWDLVGIF